MSALGICDDGGRSGRTGRHDRRTAAVRSLVRPVRRQTGNGMDLGLRVQLICDSPGEWLPRVNAGLRAHGLLPDDGLAAPPAPIRPATLLLFDDLSPQVLNAVGETSRQGRDRTLAVATSRRALGNGGVWSLLRRGASDAFAWDDVDDPIAQVA